MDGWQAETMPSVPESPAAGRTYVHRDGLRLAYEMAGTGDPAIVLVHGFACDRSYFAPQFDHFAAGRAVVAVDLRGHGDSDHPDPGPGVYDIETLADDVLAVAAAARCEAPIVVGHSLGALVALACAAREGAARAAILVEPAPILSERGKGYFGKKAGAVEADLDRSWRTAFVTGLFLPTDTARRDEIISEMPQQPPAIAAALFRAIAGFDGRCALGTVAVPLLSISGAIPSDTAADLRSSGPTVCVGQTVGAGHFNQLEVPDQVNLMIDRFLAVNGL